MIGSSIFHCSHVAIKICTACKPVLNRLKICCVLSECLGTFTVMIIRESETPSTTNKEFKYDQILFAI